MIKSRVGVIGIGEVGSAIAEIFSKNFQVFKKDINFDEIGGQKIDYLHICIPYNKKFITTAISQIKKNKPKLAVIHSTIAVGTTKEIFKKTNLPIVHSPVRGTHPNLVRDIKKFVKYIGPTDKKSGEFAKEHLKKAGLKTDLLLQSEETELGKLLDTTYFGWNILFCKMVGLLCEKLNLDFDNVYTRFNQTYNEGYKKTQPQVLRPVLSYHHHKDKSGLGIGGHCVMENTKLLHNQYHSSFTKFIIRENKSLMRKKSQ